MMCAVAVGGSAVTAANSRGPTATLLREAATRS